MDTAEVRHLRATGIRYGTLALDTGESLDSAEATLATATIAYSLRDDVEAIQWMHGHVQETGELPLLEAETVVRPLAIAMHSQSEIILPLLQLKEFDQYTTTHSTNVSVLAMAIGEYLGFAGRELRVLGVSGLLHDLGKYSDEFQIHLARQDHDLVEHACHGAAIAASTGTWDGCRGNRRSTDEARRRSGSWATNIAQADAQRKEIYRTSCRGRELFEV